MSGVKVDTRCDHRRWPGFGTPSQKPVFSREPVFLNTPSSHLSLSLTDPLQTEHQASVILSAIFRHNRTYGAVLRSGQPPHLVQTEVNLFCIRTTAECIRTTAECILEPVVISTHIGRILCTDYARNYARIMHGRFLFVINHLAYHVMHRNFC